MSRRDWGGVFALGLIVGGGLAIALLLWIVGLNYCPGDPCNYQRSPTSNPSHYEYNVPFAFGPYTGPGVEPEDRKGHINYFAQKDLRAQESVARATNAIVVISLISCVLGAMGTVLLVWNLIEARNATKENASASAAANEANEITRLEQRPWVTVKWKVPCTFSVAPDGRTCEISWLYDFENLGKSPAFRTRHEWAVYRIDTQFIGAGKFGVDDIVAKAKRRFLQMSNTPIIFPAEKTQHRPTNGFLTIEGHDVGRFFLCGCLSYALDASGRNFGIEARAYLIEEVANPTEGHTHNILRIGGYEVIETWNA